LANFAFSPATLNIQVGTKVTWTSNDSTTHTVTSDNGIFGSGNFPPNATFSYTFNTAGTFAYHCAIHTSMTGKVVVK
jgi:plastocyanin